MKKKFCLCYCPSVVETEDSNDLLLSTNNNSSLSSSMKIFDNNSDEKITNPSFNKSIHKLPSRKFFSYKNFPRLCKAILFQDSLVSLFFDFTVSFYTKVLLFGALNNFTVSFYLRTFCFLLSWVVVIFFWFFKIRINSLDNAQFT